MKIKNVSRKKKSDPDYVKKEVVVKNTNVIKPISYDVYDIVNGVKTKSSLFLDEEKHFHIATQLVTTTFDVSCHWHVHSNLDHFYYRKKKDGEVVQDWTKHECIKKGLLTRVGIVESRYDREDRPYTMTIEVKCSPSEVEPEGTKNIIVGVKSHLILSSYIQQVTEDHADIAVRITGTADQEIKLDMIVDGSDFFTETKTISASGEYDINKHIPLKTEQKQHLLVKVAYTADPTDIEQDQLTIPEKGLVPETPIYIQAVPFTEIASVMTAVIDGKHLDEAVRTSPTLYRVWHDNPHIIARDSRDSRYYLFKYGTRPTCSANYNGVYTTGEEKSYSLDNSWWHRDKLLG